MSILKQSTAATIKLGVFVDDTDGKTAETGLTISQADIRLSKNGGNIAQSHDATGATHDELGYYDVPLDATDTDTLGRLRVLVSESGALPVWQDFIVVTANVYDSLFSTDKLDVAVVEMATDVLTAASVKADAVAEIAASAASFVWETELVGNVAPGMAGYDLLNVLNHLTDIKGVGWTNETLKAIDVLIDAIKAKTDLMDASAISIVSPISGTAITILRGDTFECPISGLGSLASYVSLDFTVKANKTQADTDALIRIRLNATGLTDGLLTLNGATPSNADDGSIAITDAAAGDITITLKASMTDDLATGTYAYDVQLIEATEVSTLTSGKATVTADVTRAVA